MGVPAGGFSVFQVQGVEWTQRRLSMGSELFNTQYCLRNCGSRAGGRI